MKLSQWAGVGILATAGAAILGAMIVTSGFWPAISALGAALVLAGAIAAGIRLIVGR